jgi:thiamine biosynthesis lipoprotein
MAATATPTQTPAWEWPATGSTWRIHHSGGVDQALAVQVAAAVADDERRWSRFREDSEVSLITSCAGRPVRVSAATIDLLESCLHWSARTGGVFQPLVGATLAAWGYRRSLLDSPAGARTSPTGRAVTGSIEVDRARRVVTIPTGCVLDLGGIAKSWMARRAGAVALAHCDDPSLLIDAGGDLFAARGDHLVAVETPLRPTGPAFASARLGDGQGIATSGFGRRSWRNGDGRHAHHLIDPQTGAPGAMSHATVLADDPVSADVLAKTLALRPGLIDTWDIAAIVTVDGHTRETQRWRTVTRS